MGRRAGVRRAVRLRARLQGLDLPPPRPRGEEGLLRTRMERLRPADARDEDAAQHEAADAAVEDRAARRFRAGGQARKGPAARCAEPPPRARVRGIRLSGPLLAPSGSAPGGALLQVAP